MQHKNKIARRKAFLILWSVCIVASWCLFFFLRAVSDQSISMPMVRAFLWTTIVTGLFFGFICWLGFKILRKTDLHPLIIVNPLQDIVYPGVLTGVFLGCFVFFCDQVIFRSSLLGVIHPPFWVGVLGSLYGSVYEEVLWRFFLFTVIYFVLNKWFGVHQKLKILWAANIFIAVIVGISHVPLVFHLASPSFLEIFRLIFLSGTKSLVFGWLYWSRGLWAALTAHFVADMMIHVVLS